MYVRPHIFRERCLQKLGINKSDESRLAQVLPMLRSLNARGYSPQGAVAYIRAHEALKANGGLVIERYQPKTTQQIVAAQRAGLERKTGTAPMSFRDLERRLRDER